MHKTPRTPVLLAPTVHTTIVHLKAMSNNNNSNRNGYGFPDFSLRRLLLQTRGGRSSYTGRMCDLERGTGSNSNSGGGGSSSSSSTNKDAKSCHGSSSSSTAGGKVSAMHHFKVPNH